MVLRSSSHTPLINRAPFRASLSMARSPISTRVPSAPIAPGLALAGLVVVFTRGIGSGLSLNHQRRYSALSQTRPGSHGQGHGLLAQSQQQSHGSSQEASPAGASVSLFPFWAGARPEEIRQAANATSHPCLMVSPCG